MCISAEVSLLAFIVGTGFNIKVFIDANNNPNENNINYKLIAVMYQFVVFMQLFDMMVWLDKGCKSYGKIGTLLAFFNTMLQPVFIIVLFLLFTQELNIYKKLASFVTLLVYVGSIAYMFYYNPNNIKPIDCMYIKDGCSEMFYKWTDNLYPYGKLSYILSISISILLLIKSSTFASIQVIFFVGIYLLSRTLYECGMPSVWCLYACLAPMLNYFLMYKKI